MEGSGAADPRAEQEALARVARAVADAATPDRVFALAAREAAALLGADAGAVWRFDGSAAVAAGAWAAPGVRTPDGRVPLAGAGPVSRVHATGAPARVRVGDLAGDDPLRRLMAGRGLRSAVAAPVRREGRIWGAVMAALREDRGFAEDAGDRLDRFAGLIASALATTEDRRALAERTAEQAALRRVATAVATGTPPEDVFTLVSREAAQLVGADAGAVLELAGDGRAAIRAAWREDAAPPPPLGVSLPLAPEVLEALGTGAPARTRRPAPTGGPNSAWRSEYEDIVSVPIMVEGRPWGLVSVGAAAGADLPATVEDRLARFAELAGAAIANAEARRALRDGAAEQAALRRVATAVAADRDHGILFPLACREAAALLGAASGIVVRIDPEGAMHVAGSWQAEGFPPPTGVARTLAARARAGAIDPGPWRERYGESVVTPVRVRNRVWGVLCVSPPEGRRLPAGSTDRLGRFAELLGAAIANAENRQAIVDAAHEQAALRQVATAIAADAEPDEVFDMVCRAAAHLLGVPAAGVMRIAGDRLDAVASWTADGHAGPAVAGVPDLRAHPGRTARLRGGAVARLAPGDDAPEWVRAHRDVVAAPIVLDGELWGTLAVASAAAPISRAMEGRLASFADLVGVAIASAESRRRSVDDAAALIAHGGLDMEATLRAIVASARRALNADRATCIVLDEEGAPEASYSTEDGPGFRDEAGARVREGAGRAILTRLLAEKEGLVEREDVASLADERELAASIGAGAYLALRLEHASVAAGSGGAVLGVMFITFRAPRRFTARDRVAARSLASIAELALANARLHGRTLEHLAQAELRAATDPLTGLANHRVFHERLAAEVERARAGDAPLALALFDLDRFAGVNARHGHQLGDHVLAEVAARLAGHVGPAGFLARIGGEEFAWVLPGGDSLEAWQAADRAREAVRLEPFSHGERLTLSAGVADLRQARDAGDLLRLAEGALYWAKAHGRDVTFRYSPEVVEELSAEERVARLERSQSLNAIRVLARAVDAKDPSTLEHSERVAQWAQAIARELGWIAERGALLHEAGLVHDVGKIGVPDHILFKPGRLEPAEYEEVKQHAALGARIVADVLRPEQVAWVRSHHERVDGTGYPDGLAGDRIPLGARILAVADAWDVMTSMRPYSAPIPPHDARAEFRRMAGVQFSPEVVAALERVLEAGAAPVPGAHGRL